MFLFRSIRRKLFCGFTMALALLLMVGAAGMTGLFWHREAVQDLDRVLYRTPSSERLNRAVGRVAERLYGRGDPQTAAGYGLLRRAFIEELQNAVSELQEFRRQVEAVRPAPELFAQREQLVIRLDRIGRDLVEMARLQDAIQPPGSRSTTLSFEEARTQVMRTVAGIQRTVDSLPALNNQQHLLAMSLARESRRSEVLLKFIMAVAGLAIVLYCLTVYFGFQWISKPLRSVAQGASRIANGDTTYRLDQTSRWEDEFHNLVLAVNRMADRFQESREDLEAKVEERSRQLVRTERLASVGFLAAGVAHEINNPLSSITMAAESIQMRLLDLLPEEDEDAQLVLKRLTMIRQESRRCGEITARLLNFSRSETMHMQREDLAEVMDEVLAMIAHLGRYSDRNIHFTHDGNVVAELCRSRIKQLIINLISNALQATTSGGNVWITLHEEVDSVLITVRDDGQGMDDATVSRLFEPFFTTKEAGQGTGLGLSIAHRIVEEHHGTITPASAGLGRGCSFTIRLPRRQPQSAAA